LKRIQVVCKIIELAIMLKSAYRILVELIILALLVPIGIASAQEASPQEPVYVVQTGDSLWGIALKFGVSVDELSAVNGITDPNQLTVGTELVIPGLKGVSGRLVTSEVPFGENLESLSHKYQISQSDLAKINRLVSPVQVYRGANLILPESSAGDSQLGRGTVHKDTSMLEMAVADGANPWQIISLNAMSNPWQFLGGDTLAMPTDNGSGPGALPDVIQEIDVDPERIEQGSTVVLHYQSDQPVNMQGLLGDQELHFLSDGQDNYALQGIYALQLPGFYPLTLNGTLEDGSPFQFTQWVYIGDAGYPFDPSLTVDPSVVDPAVTEPENEQVAAITAPITPEKMWEGQFTAPVAPEFADCFPSRFGNRRSYNGSAYDYFHSGLDFCGAVGNDVIAPARGKVVFAGPLTVRGNTTIIDHGWGVYTIYMHQSEFLVKVGDIVEAGQRIGLVGATGRVTGPHLHWEVWAGGVQVDPIYWLQQPYP
jgi:murein DD-endopeptidase MepM/ murein hydrolase activator NlpD